MVSPDISSQIVIVGTDPRGRGGIATVINEHQKLLPGAGFVKIHQSGPKKFILPLTAIFRSLRYVGKRHKVFHVHSASFSDFYRCSIFVMLYKLIGKKVILHIHGAKFEEFYGDGNRFVKYICNKADGLATVSTHFVDFLKRKKLNDRVWLVHNSLPVAPPANLPPKNQTSENIVFSYFGALDNRKGIFEVVEAIDEYRHLFTKGIKLIIGGNGDKSHLEKLIADGGIGDIVEFRGWLDAEGKDRLLRESDVFIHPSRFESFGISILEAMNYGLPVITTAVGGIKDLVTDNYNGIIVECGNRSQIASAMAKMIENPAERIRMGRNSSLHAADFSPAAIEHQLTDMYTEFITEK